MCYIIYKTINRVNGKIYVGQHCTSANDGYLGSGIIIKQAIKKYGKENFIRETLEYCTSANMNERERFWIAELSATNRNIGYNIQIGGEGAGLMSNETKTKISNSRIGKYCGINNPNYDNHKICGKNNYMYGKHHSEESKRKISENRRRMIGEDHPRYGKHHTEESKLKISQRLKGKKSYNLGKKMSEDQKQKIRRSLHGRRVNESTRQKMRERNYTNNSMEKCSRNKYRYFLSDGRDYWKDLSRTERNTICWKFGIEQKDIITFTKGCFKDITIIRKLK